MKGFKTETKDLKRQITIFLSSLSLQILILMLKFIGKKEDP